LLLKIPSGRVSTYKAIAQALNCKAYQAVGNAMNQNPNPISVPCHRVVNSDGRLGGYAFGSERKAELLREEGIVILEGKVQNFQTVLFDFTEVV
jgi:methylated-DNA-[protein]-cysteine S-methyltransferase